MGGGRPAPRAPQAAKRCPRGTDRRLMDHQTDRQLVLIELAVLLVIGIPAFGIALLCALYVWTYTGPQFDVVFFNDDVVGGISDKVVAMVLATLSGGIGIFVALRFRR